MSASPLAIGIDFGGTTVKCGVVDGSAIIARADPIPTPDFDGPGPLLDAMGDTIRQLVTAHPGIAAVGVGMPGFVDFGSGLVHGLTNVPGWTKIPVRDELERRCQLPCQVDNDANAMAYAEWRLGAGRGSNHMVALTLGTGVGGGIIADGRLLRGARSVAGELGQTSIDYRGREGAYGNLGALEDYIGNREITADAILAYAAAGQPRSESDCQPAALSQSAAAGDPIALALWQDIAQKLACALVDCCYLLNPEIIVIGGGVAKAGPILFDPLQESLNRRLAPAFREHLSVVPAQFGNEAGILGTARIALEEAGLA